MRSRYILQRGSITLDLTVACHFVPIRIGSSQEAFAKSQNNLVRSSAVEKHSVKQTKFVFISSMRFYVYQHMTQLR